MDSHFLRAHQKLNKLAHRVLNQHARVDGFPTIREINRFEGSRGPDALKMKAAGHDELHHYYDPAAESGSLLGYIQNHYRQLVAALARGDSVRSAFEASWLAHAITDGMTPAHHFTHNVLDEARSNHGLYARVTDKLIVRGDGWGETLSRTWQLIGAGGVLSTHIYFELGAAAVMRTSGLVPSLNRALLNHSCRVGAVGFFKQQAKIVDQMGLYETFASRGWTGRLARDIKHRLTPLIAETIAIIWCLAYEEARQ